ncbi:imidazole glycerol phosphate synthase subunit HisH [Qipengyuania sediminis]|uniref:imidazole glycerol phosphate synthase subunit HisH n=1 Tax=Qipengyuania sediminis TaxID=1532023 RepID=UPI00197E6609|nr:imidazole glycerol phosphate synthase subunit HisH [Qipengyuania sediminis]
MSGERYPIGIIDYGVGNLGSVRNMLRRAGHPAAIVGMREDMARCDKLILPGVGAFDRAIERLEASGLRDMLDEMVLHRRVPTLGICLGMQLLTRGSEEGNRPGLGYIAAETRRFPAGTGLKVPHMGWNLVAATNPSPLTAHFSGETRFYFVHSYRVSVDDDAHSMLTCSYGGPFDAGIMAGNVYGAQFHPEKSHRFGRAFLAAFGAL